MNVHLSIWDKLTRVVIFLLLVAAVMGPLGLAVTLWLAGRIHMLNVEPKAQIA